MNVPKIIILFGYCFLSLSSISLAETIATKTSKHCIAIEVDGCAAIMSVSASTNGISCINTTILYGEKEIKVPAPIFTKNVNSVIENLEKCIGWTINSELHKLNIKKDLDTYTMKNEDGEYFSIKIFFESSDEGKTSHIILEYKCSTVKGTHSIYLTPSQAQKLTSLLREIPTLETAAKEEAKKADKLLK